MGFILNWPFFVNCFEFIDVWDIVLILIDIVFTLFVCAVYSPMTCYLVGYNDAISGVFTFMIASFAVFCLQIFDFCPMPKYAKKPTRDELYILYYFPLVYFILILIVNIILHIIVSRNTYSLFSLQLKLIKFTELRDYHNLLFWSFYANISSPRIMLGIFIIYYNLYSVHGQCWKQMKKGYLVIDISIKLYLDKLNFHPSSCFQITGNYLYVIPII